MGKRCVWHRRLNLYRLGNCEMIWMTVCSLLSLIIAFIVRAAVGSPYRVISYCGLQNIIPLVWVMVLVWIVFYILLGGAYGSVMGCVCCHDDALRYKGGMLFVLMMALGYVWYPLFFGAAALFAALFVCEAVLILSVMCAILFMRVRKWAGWVMVLYSIWMLYMVMLNFMCCFTQ